MPNSVAIIGGGFCGLLTAKFLKLLHPHLSISIIEKNKLLGGLFNPSNFSSFRKSSYYHSFDVGVHFLLSSTCSEINSFLLDEFERSRCHVFHNSLPESHILNSTYFPSSGCPSLSSLTPSIAHEIEHEILDFNIRVKYSFNHQNLEQFLVTNFGELVTRQIYSPIYQKLTGAPLNLLSQHIHGQFFPYRLIPQRSSAFISQLKEYPPHDDRIGFASYSQSTSSIIKFYPFQGGISSWVNNLVHTLIDLQVDIFTDTSISSIEYYSPHWNIHSRNSTSLPSKYDFIVSTIPFNLFEKYLPDVSTFIGPLPSTMHAQSISTSLQRYIFQVNFVFDKSPLSTSFWINNYDFSSIIWRINNYSAYVSNIPANFYPVSVEIIVDSYSDSSLQLLTQRVFDELIALNLIPHSTHILHSEVHPLPNHYRSYILDTQYSLQNSISNYQSRLSQFCNLGPLPFSSNNQSSIIQRSYEFAKNFPFH